MTNFNNECSALTRITFNPAVMAGQACIRGMRIPVSLIVNLVAHGMSTNEIIEEYPSLESADVREALEYASRLTREQVFSREVEPAA
ncbi:MAG: DUF433 domain-containing protein [Chloroflexota bacterium]|nr:DUF433 domain-containing protein [Chloroflexota bacterium]